MTSWQRKSVSRPARSRSSRRCRSGRHPSMHRSATSRTKRFPTNHERARPMRTRPFSWLRNDAKLDRVEALLAGERVANDDEAVAGLCEALVDEMVDRRPDGPVRVWVERQVVRI